MRLLFSSMADLYHVNFKLQRAYILLCDYRNRGHLDKVDESGYRKITIPRRLVVGQSVAYKNNKLLEAR